MKKTLLLLVAMMISVASFAQVTTSSISGQVTDTNGEALIGATVIAVHTPSGTQYGAVANNDGFYYINGTRSGGPYSIEVSYVGCQTQIFENINIPLGENYAQNAKLKDSQDIDAVYVTTTSAERFDNSKTGAATNITTTDIAAMPSVSRSITDIIRLSPYSNGTSFAGGDGRSSNFTVDGANLNNNFGLSSALPGGGTPISIDALEEIQVVISPYDVRQTNFIGGGINAVTKSGTNTFSGSAYTYQYNENMRGNTVDGTDLGDRATDGRQTYGFTLGGPIVKDKLFFFTNFEYELRPTTVINWSASENGVSDADNYISETSKEQMELVKQYLKDEYGYDTGSYTDFPADESNMKILARIDWNISDNHKLALRYNYTKNMAWNETNGNSTAATYRMSNYDRVGYESMVFANTMYSMDNIVSSFSADLNSRFGDKVSNQLLVTYSNISDMRGSTSDAFPFIEIMDGYSYDVDGNKVQTLEPMMSTGYELFSWNNGVNNTIFNIKDDVTYYAGAHKLTAGLSFESQMANNSFMRYGTGYYRYSSIEDFLSGAAPETVGLTIGYGGELNPAAEVRFNQAGLYLQDDFTVNEKFKLNFGIRFDNIFFNEDDIATNSAVLAYDFGGKSIDTGVWPTSNLQISPRVGFSWDVNGDGSVKLRGGSGVFTGRIPLVFFTNMPTNSNMVQNTQTISTSYNPDGTIESSNSYLQNFAGGLVTDPNEIAELMGMSTTITDSTATASSTIVGIDPDYKMPQVWKSSLAVDYQLPVSFPFTATAEFMYTKNIYASTVVNYNVKDINTGGTWDTFEGSDNRYIYPSDYLYYSAVSGGACVLTNTSKGYGYTANITLNARPATNLSLMAAYTRTESQEISGMPGSQAYSSWQNLYSINGPNNADLQRSQYVIPDRVIASATYTLPYKSNFTATHLSMFYSGYSPYGNTYVYSNDMNGDGVSYDLMYIPADKDDIRFVSTADEDAYWSFAAQDKYLTKHAGEYAGSYEARAPWVHIFDLRVAQDFYITKGKNTNKLQLEASFSNIGNMLNSSWGVTQTNAGANYGAVLKYEGQDSDGYPTYSTNVDANASTYSYNKAYYECWSVQVGLRYYFN